MDTSADLITVVIPTILRPELGRAIASVRSQRDVRVELIVVADSDRATVNAAGSLTAGADHVLHTGGQRRGGYARNLGTDAATGAYIAYLDDDDWWEPSKLSKQLAALMKAPTGSNVVVGTRVRQYDATNMIGGRASPVSLIEHHETLEQYLFLKRKPTAGRASFFTSTIFAARETLEMVRWDETLKRHQDWDYLLQLQASGASFMQLGEALTNYAVGSEDSVSSTIDWEGSLNWAKKWHGRWSRRVYADFLTAQPLRYAIQSRSRRGVKKVASALLEGRRVPNFGPALFAIGAFLPRKRVVQIMIRERKQTKRGIDH